LNEGYKNKLSILSKSEAYLQKFKIFEERQGKSYQNQKVLKDRVQIKG
jgi:hypothetical protein